jgi:hypothetical protein
VLVPVVKVEVHVRDWVDVVELDALLLELVTDAEEGLDVVDETADLLVEIEAEDEDTVELEVF